MTTYMYFYSKPSMYGLNQPGLVNQRVQSLCKLVMGPLYFLTLVLLQYYQTCSVFLTSIGNAKFNFAAYQHLQLSIVFSEQRNIQLSSFTGIRRLISLQGMFVK